MSYLKTQTPTGGDVTQRTDRKPAFSNHLFEQVLQRGNLQAAWKQVRANKGAAGIDSMSIEAFPDWATRLDSLLWYRQWVSALCRTRSLDPTQSQDGLLATVEKAAHQSQKLVETRRTHSVSSCVWYYQQRPMAQFKDPRDSTGII